LLGIDKVRDNYNTVALVSSNGLWIKQHGPHRTWE
jgi:hypothetical protein